MIKKLHLLNVFFLLFVAFGYSQETLSLQQSIEIGLKNNYQIQIAERNLEIAQNSNDWSIAGRYPNINATLNWNNNFVKSNNPASFFPENTSLSSGIVPGAELTWTLYNGSRIRLTKQQLEQLQQVAQGNVQIEVENTIQSIILAYYQALVQQEQLRLREEVLNLSRDRLEYARVRVEFGQAASFDVLQSQDAYLNDSTNYLIQKNTFENAIRDLNTAMGVDALSTSYQLTDQLQFVVQTYTLEDLKNRMLVNNRTLQNLFVTRELAAIGTRIEETSQRPQINLRVGLTDNINYNIISKQVNINGDERDFSDVRTNALNTNIGVSLVYNVFDWGVRKRNIQNARIEEITAQLNIEDQKRTLNGQLETTYATFNNQRQLVEVTNQLVNNAQRSLSIAGDRFDAGLINVFDYRVVQLSYVSAVQSRLNAIYNLKTTETDLIKLIGGLVR
ncbi:MAG: TolC family protein [Saprospiraceae bacterium]|nr:TolC family protein [Saprospiraceae bacterium]